MPTWLKRLVIAVLLVPGCALLVISWTIGPYVVEDQRLDAIVMAVALDWRDFGLEKGRARLQVELDRQIGAQVGDDDCQMVEDAEGKHVTCAWGVHVPLPGLERVVPLSFRSAATIDPTGDLK